MIILLIILVLLVFYYIVKRNAFVKMEVQINEALSGIDVALEKRFDTLTKMYDLAKNYMQYEKSTLMEVVRLRQGNIQEKQEASKIMDDFQKSFDVTLENYPELRSSQNILELQKAVREVEDHLQASRRLYNNNVSIYNQAIVVFPSNLIANMMSLSKKEFFALSQGKEDVSFK